MASMHYCHSGFEWQEAVRWHIQLYPWADHYKGHWQPQYWPMLVSFMLTSIGRHCGCWCPDAKSWNFKWNKIRRWIGMGQGTGWILEQLERLRFEYTPAASWLPILLSHIVSQVKRRQSQSYKFKEFVKISFFLILKRTDGQGETSIPPFNFIEAGGIITAVVTCWYQDICNHNSELCQSSPWTSATTKLTNASQLWHWSALQLLMSWCQIPIS